MKIFSQQDAAEFLKTGAREFRHNRSVLVTPGARDLLVAAGVRVAFTAGEGEGGGPAPAASGQPRAAGASEIERIFHSEEAERVKRDICDIGRRLWEREYVDGNGGNISYRIAPEMFLCTPTLVSKGFLRPEMICMVDMEGKQIAGTSKRTSEINTHLAIYKHVPEARAVVHAHPVYATAFAIAGVEPPTCLIPELEVFVGRVPIAPYETPGTPEVAATVGPLAPKHQSILMGNHGVICWGRTVEDAHWRMEITEAFCKTVSIGAQLPGRGTSIPCEKVGELLEIKKGLGLPDARHGLKPVELCEVDPWQGIKNRPVACSTGDCSCAGAESLPVTNAELEGMIQAITDQIIAGMDKGG